MWQNPPTCITYFCSKGRNNMHEWRKLHNLNTEFISKKHLYYTAVKAVLKLDMNWPNTFSTRVNYVLIWTEYEKKNRSDVLKMKKDISVQTLYGIGITTTIQYMARITCKCKLVVTGNPCICDLSHFWKMFRKSAILNWTPVPLSGIGVLFLEPHFHSIKIPTDQEHFFNYKYCICFYKHLLSINHTRAKCIIYIWKNL